MLILYDFGSQSLSIGDLLLFHQAALVLREQYQVDTVDFALVYESEKPLASQNPISAAVTRREFAYHLAPLLPLVQFTAHVGSFFVFDSRQRFERFVADNADAYHVWPSALLYSGREYLLYYVLNELLYPHFRKHGSLPVLRPRPDLIDWALGFHRRTAGHCVPVSVQLRSNPRFGQSNNSIITEWLEFFRRCEATYPAMFTVIGASAEIDDRFRACNNVVIAKDHHTSVEQDLALIHTAALHLGADSGPVVMAIFGDKPYLAVPSRLSPHLHRDMIVEGSFHRFYFANPLQRYYSGHETADLLSREFARMWEAMDRAPSQAAAASEIPETVSWLR